MQLAVSMSPRPRDLHSKTGARQIIVRRRAAPLLALGVCTLPEPRPRYGRNP